MAHNLGALRFLHLSRQECRLAVFWARYHADHLESNSIEPEHILLGLIQEDPSLVTRFLPSEDSLETVRADLARSVGADPESLATVDEASLWRGAPARMQSHARELPLRPQAARLLARAVEVADEERSRAGLPIPADLPPSPVPPQRFDAEGPPAPEMVEWMRRMQEAARRGDPGYVKPGHLLIACLSLPGTPCEQILTAHGLRLEEVRKRLTEGESEG